MGTRGSVAWVQDGKVVGVYNHWDSYPSGLGVDVYRQARLLGVQGLIDSLRMWGDWREFVNGGICKYCGKAAGQPHSISGKALFPETNDPYPDPDALHHSHGDGAADQFDPFEDPLFMEWIYLLRPENNTIEVWTFANGQIIELLDKKRIPHTNGKFIDTDTLYIHMLASIIDMSMNEPALEKDETWEEIRNNVYRLKDEGYESQV